ncbi:hypothetical protein Vadar_010184 [Vaccinium darrowii]|uniref:Uncharacterized protein n=1 Tax=Vaccinium darrowii TaxID=229202 RepID=A0ACB7YKC3_9ERIC|nr:hypothetical protein Vadar_010184 [Vaccinium darrowii]
MAVSGGSSSVPSLPPPQPKSPPKYPDLYGKRRELAKVQMLEREISFLEEELRFVHGLQPASRSCKEYVNRFQVSCCIALEQPVLTSRGFAVSNALLVSKCQDAAVAIHAAPARVLAVRYQNLGIAALAHAQDVLTRSHAAATVAYRGVPHA